MFRKMMKVVNTRSSRQLWLRGRMCVACESWIIISRVLALRFNRDDLKLVLKSKFFVSHLIQQSWQCEGLP